MLSNGFDEFSQAWLPRLEEEMRDVLDNSEAAVDHHYRMMHYHMGWLDEAFRPGDFPVGKRIRPLLCLMACEAVGGGPQQALPAAAAVEILHNFSLIHDDLEDRDEIRRHRPTVWALWGEAQAINAGDGMFALAYAALQRLPGAGVSATKTLAALNRFTQTCVSLTEGQHLDLRFEEQAQVTVDEYMRMIEGKTASLIAASLSIGALVGGADSRVDDALHRFGRCIGLAFQIQDDILGIWGDPDVTGKAAGNDILRRKKSLPLLYALEHPVVGPDLQTLWAQASDEGQIAAVMHLLARAEARAYAQDKLLALHRTGVQALEEALGMQALSSPLMELADALVARQA